MLFLRKFWRAVDRECSLQRITDGSKRALLQNGVEGVVFHTLGLLTLMEDLSNTSLGFFMAGMVSNNAFSYSILERLFGSRVPHITKLFGAAALAFPIIFVAAPLEIQLATKALFIIERLQQPHAEMAPRAPVQPSWAAPKSPGLGH